MISVVRGDILESKACVLVNPVNTDGIMGKGLALQFKNKFPEMFLEYKEVCKKGGFVIGEIHVWQNPDKNPAFIVNFPTKKSWRDKSKIEYITCGLDELTTFMNLYKIPSVAIPPLGCGLGGLDWTKVRALIWYKMHDLVCPTEVTIYEPY